MFSKNQIKQLLVGLGFKLVWTRNKIWRVYICGVVVLFAMMSAEIAQSADGDLDPTFGSGGKLTIQIAADERDFANALAVQPDGKIIVGGELGEFSGPGNSAVLVRLNPNGSLDSTFGSGGKVVNSAQHHLPSLVLQPDGKIVTAATTSGGFTVNFAVARYNSDGTLDQSFGTGGYASNGDGTATRVLLQPDGKIILVGTLPIYRNGSDFLLGRFNADGTPDTTFGNGGRLTTSFTSGLNSSDVAMCAALQSDGKLVVGGAISCISVALVRYNSNGTIDNGFGLDGRVLTPNFGGSASSIVIQPDGKILIGGGGFVIGRYTADGRVDHSFGVDGKISGGFGNGTGFMEALTIDQNGRILAGGSVAYSGTGNDAFALSRYSSDGFPDPGFGNNGFVLTEFTGCLDDASALVLQADGKPVLAGYAAEPGCSYHDVAVSRYSVKSQGPKSTSHL